jgi:pyridoxal phosphate enzyme (YggS family)
MSQEQLQSNLLQVRARIAAAAAQYGRNPQAIRLLAISKGQPEAAIRALTLQGQMDFGENYLQEALAKISALDDLPITWHYTGQLQSNKTRAIAEHFQWVHTVDRERIASRLNEQRPHHAPPINVCLQILLHEEPGKGGIPPSAAAQLAAQIRLLPRLKLRGLMCIPPAADSFAQQRAWFDQLARCMQDLNAQGFELDTLSMGMSGDLEAAIAAGATWVRVGTAVFGERSR